MQPAPSSNEMGGSVYVQKALPRSRPCALILGTSAHADPQKFNSDFVAAPIIEGVCVPALKLSRGHYAAEHSSVRLADSPSPVPIGCDSPQGWFGERR
jgi:hypothetical protein